MKCTLEFYFDDDGFLQARRNYDPPRRIIDGVVQELDERALMEVSDEQLAEFNARCIAQQKANGHQLHPMPVRDADEPIIVSASHP